MPKKKPETTDITGDQMKPVPDDSVTTNKRKRAETPAKAKKTSEAKLGGKLVADPQSDQTAVSSDEKKTKGILVQRFPKITGKSSEDSTAQSSSLPAKVSSGLPAATEHQIVNFYETDFKRLDKDLSDPERDEWNAIYASFRSKSILTGTVIGVDENVLPIKNSETGRTEMRTIYSLVIIGYRVKILIPETAVWLNGDEREKFLMRGMLGATVDYVITNVDREGECCLASRASAISKRRRAFLSNTRTAPKSGDIVKCSMLVVGSKRCLVTYNGYDVPLRTRDMSYTPILDMREIYRPGQEFNAKFLGYDAANDRLGLSVKLATPNPFDGAERRHPVGRRRQAVICGKYGGGVFCTLPDGTVVMCLYSNNHLDSEFLLGDSVIVHIVEYDYKHKFIYGRIVSKW